MGSTMSKTIALKLSEKEDQIVKQLNKQGITNSELLRNALRQYFEYLHESIAQEFEKESITQLDEHNLSTFHESFEGLKGELEELREQTKKTKEQIENNIVNLQNQLHQLSRTSQVIKQTREPTKANIVTDIHYEVDEFLKKGSHRDDLLRK
jgi:uncharacterized phage infection (PIP) family protein YhgE